MSKKNIIDIWGNTYLYIKFNIKIMYMNFERALSLLKEGLSAGRDGWKPAKVIRLKMGKYVISSDGKAVDLSGLGLGMNKYYEPGGEIHRYPKFVMNKEDGSEIEVRLGIEDYLSEDWYIGDKDMHFSCVDKEGYKDTEKVRHTLEGVIVDLGKGEQGLGGQCANKVTEEVKYPDFVCIKDDEIRKVKKGSIFRYDKEISGTHYFHYYYYDDSTKGKIYIPLANLTERYQYYQELRKTTCEIVDKWHVTFKAIPKVEEPKEEYPNYVCIKNDEIRGIKSGSILRYIGKNSFKAPIYYYKNSNGSRTYIHLVELKEKFQNYQEISKTICIVLDEWHVRFTGLPEEVKPYRVERISIEEVKKGYDVDNNANSINECKENLAIDKDSEWQEVVVMVNGGVVEIKFENRSLITFRIPKKKKSKKDIKPRPKRYIGVRPSGPNTNGNLNDIWVEQADGKYRCDKKQFPITREELESDLRNGYLVEIGDDITKGKKWIPEKYIGLRHSDAETTGNLFDVWIEQADGNFKCTSKSFVISREEVLADVRNGCLGKMKESGV